MDRREHHRVRLQLPVRLRWAAPFGQTTEISETLDVSRSGLRLRCQQPHAPGVVLWVTFPYDESLRYGQPEMVARVVRLTNVAKGPEQIPSASDLLKLALALHFEEMMPSAANGHSSIAERRISERRPIALPVCVRLEKIPWFEEAMTIDISAEGLRFLSNRQYACGQELLVSFEASVSAPWPSAAEQRSKVVRVEPLRETPALAVTIQRL